MMATIDKAGRVVIPKTIRDRFDLISGSELEIVVLRDAIRLERRRQPTRALAWTDDGRPFFPSVPGQTTTDADVQDLRDALQR
ncbi:MAG: AbrB/MazE/SpoVT family DNA-binding domain-containing protein [Propionibacteriaceae bacterium]|nr:AbrB/MazE/SpoVT family DNA-binding domain-containing protein [Propionibacteriaceae bacterium]